MQLCRYYLLIIADIKANLVQKGSSNYSVLPTVYAPFPPRDYFLALLTSLFNISFHSSRTFCVSNFKSIPPPLLKFTVRHLDVSASDIALAFLGGPLTTEVT